MGTTKSLEDALETFLQEHLADVDVQERVVGLLEYARGLGLEQRSKTLSALAEALCPQEREACRQRMQRALQRGRYCADLLHRRIQRSALKALRFDAYCIDDTGIEKKGRHSPGVARQYSGTLGKVGNCQVVVSTHAVSNAHSVCLATRLYLPQGWVNDAPRRARAGVPDEVVFQTKHELALEQLRQLAAHDAPRLPVVMDAGFGDSRALREGVRALRWPYVAAVLSTTKVWSADAPLEPAPYSGRGRRPRRFIAGDGAQPRSVLQLATEAWEAGRFRSIHWRTGSRGPLHCPAMALRVRSAEGHAKKQPPGPEEWLVIERDSTRDCGFRFYLSSLPKKRTSLRQLLNLAKMRWRIERDYQDMKQHLGFDRYEGRHWTGLHRHLALVTLMHLFITLHRERFSPGGDPITSGVVESFRADAFGRPRPHAPSVPVLLARSSATRHATMIKQC